MRHWLRVCEATALLLTARVLVGAVRFDRWRGSLGVPVAMTGPIADADEDPRALALVLAAHRRAVARLPLPLKCLPQSMALHWMLRRRGMASVLVIGALPRRGRQRGHIDDLHAWVWVSGAVQYGESEAPYAELLRLG